MRCIRSILGWSPGHGNFPRMVAVIMLILLNKNCGGRDRPVLKTLHCGRSNPGSNLGHGNFFSLLHSVYLAIFLRSQK